MTVTNSLITSSNRQFHSIKKSGLKPPFSGKQSQLAHSPSAIRQHYCDMLSPYPFEWFITLTFRYPNVTVWTADEMLRKMVRRSERALYGRYRAGKSRDKSLSLVAFMERNFSNGIHFHCLVQPPTDLGKLRDSARYPSVIRKAWVKSGGGYMFDCKPILNQHDAYVYLRYSTKQLGINNNCVQLDWFRRRTG